MILSKFINIYNLINLHKLFFLCKNPLRLIYFYLTKNYKFFKVRVKTPVGLVNIKLHNRQAVQTFYSIFIREDYYSEENNTNFIDCGSNIGLAAIYFLTRNKYNKVYCVEPDKYNQRLLQENLKQFQGRFLIDKSLVDTDNSNKRDFYLSKDGKHSRKLPLGLDYFKEKTKVEAKTLEKLFALAYSFFNSDKNITLKIDIEGNEKKIISNFQFSKYPQIKHLMHELLEFSCFSDNFSDNFDREIKYKTVNNSIVLTEFLD